MALPRVYRELSEVGRISVTTLLLLMVAYGGLGGCAIAAALVGEWPFAMPASAGIGVGATMVGVGGALCGAAHMQFRSFRLTWGLRTDRLVTEGIYSWSRNPQSMGWALVLAGAALMGRSGSTLALAVVYWVSCLVWIPLEERVLQRRFGQAYDEYRRRVPRYLGILRASIGDRPGRAA
jgi:protein-S-isoprenylcysteine O-methyltransferase Ste14